MPTPDVESERVFYFRKAPLMYGLFPDVLRMLDTWYGKARHGPMHLFVFSTETGLSGRDVEYMLRRYGIRIWDRKRPEPRTRSFLVNVRQAVWAEYLMCRAGVPLLSPILDERNLEYMNAHEPGTMPTPWSKGIGAKGIMDVIADVADVLSGNTAPPAI